jgi:hypothetical protein
MTNTARETQEMFPIPNSLGDSDWGTKIEEREETNLETLVSSFNFEEQINRKTLDSETMRKMRRMAYTLLETFTESYDTDIEIIKYSTKVKYKDKPTKIIGQKRVRNRKTKQWMSLDQALMLARDKAMSPQLFDERLSDIRPKEDLEGLNQKAYGFLAHYSNLNPDLGIKVIEREIQVYSRDEKGKVIRNQDTQKPSYRTKKVRSIRAHKGFVSVGEAMRIIKQYHQIEEYVEIGALGKEQAEESLNAMKAAHLIPKRATIRIKSPDEYKPISFEDSTLSTPHQTEIEIPNPKDLEAGEKFIRLVDQGKCDEPDDQPSYITRKLSEKYSKLPDNGRVKEEREPSFWQKILHPWQSFMDWRYNQLEAKLN